MENGSRRTNGRSSEPSSNCMATATSGSVRTLHRTSDIKSHERLRADGLALRTGTYTVETVSARLDDESGAAPPSQAVDGPNRRWAVGSAALDLALKQAGETLASALDRTCEPVRFVVSPQLGDPPSIEPLHRVREPDPTLEFKIDVPADPSDALLSELTATMSVRPPIRRYTGGSSSCFRPRRSRIRR